MANSTQKKIVIVDYGVGNLGSVVNMLKKIGATCCVSNNREEILSADKLILPGVGAFDQGMKRLHEAGLDEAILEAAAAKKKPEIMGLCLGMQLLTSGSEEGRLQGLNLIPGYAKKFKVDIHSKLKVPHMGWNIVKPAKSHYLLNKLPEESRFYFVHSYYVECDDRTDVLMNSIYYRQFDSGIQRDNISGFQFHPEKSHSFGSKLFSNFAKGMSC